MEAIRVLIVCCASSVGGGDEKIEDVTLFFGRELSGGNGDGQASGSAARKWQAMINWVQLVPERFLKLVERGDGAGLVVVCYVRLPFLVSFLAFCLSFFQELKMLAVFG